MPQPIAKSELPIVQKTYDLIKWYVPILNRLPRDHKFGLGATNLQRFGICWTMQCIPPPPALMFSGLI